MCDNWGQGWYVVFHPCCSFFKISGSATGTCWVCIYIWRDFVKPQFVVMVWLSLCTVILSSLVQPWTRQIYLRCTLFHFKCPSHSAINYNVRWFCEMYVDSVLCSRLVFAFFSTYEALHMALYKLDYYYWSIPSIWHSNKFQINPLKIRSSRLHFYSKILLHCSSTTWSLSVWGYYPRCFSAIDPLLTNHVIIYSVLCLSSRYVWLTA